MTAAKVVAVSLMLTLILFAGQANATRWLLVDFGKDEGTTTFGTQYPTWNQLLRHPSYTEFVDPDGNPDHWGIADKAGSSPGNDVTYYGVQGTAPIDFQIPHRIVATFYNRGSVK